jgi:NAD(P)-dependent dehydrogenase (short-subunit alcohol dehydrogenase family)
MFKDNALQGKTAFITGGGTGLGKSMAKKYLLLGANVIIASRKLDVIEATASELASETGGQVLGLACDVRKYDDIERVMATGIEKFGQIDILVNNAAGNFISPTERLSHRAFDTIVDIVLKGTYNCTLALGKYWIDKEIKGTVLSITTTYAWTGSAYVVPSACGKAGVLALTRSLASEWGKYGIRLNCIAPGPFYTEGAFDRLFPKEVADLVNPIDRIPLGRLGDHEELANLAAYLVSEFSGYITGEVVTMDGGEWINGAGEFNFFHKVPKEMWDVLERSVRGANKNK